MLGSCQHMSVLPYPSLETMKSLSKVLESSHLLGVLRVLFLLRLLEELGNDDLVSSYRQTIHFRQFFEDSIEIWVPLFACPSISHPY